MKRIGFTYGILVFLLALNGTGKAQSLARQLRMARAMADDANFSKASTFYKAVLEKDSLHYAANMELGILLLDYMEQPKASGQYLLRAERVMRKDTMPELYYEIGKYFQKTDQLEKAKSYYTLFSKYIADNEDGRRINKQLTKDLADCNYGIENKNVYTNVLKVDVKNAGSEINTSFPEYVPVVLHDKSAIVFTSRRGDHKSGDKIDYDGMGFYEDIFIASNSNGKFTDPKLFLKERTSFAKDKKGLLHRSIISLSNDGYKMYIYKNQKLYESNLVNGLWSTPVEMENPLNKGFYQNHVSTSGDGKMMFFSAEKSKSRTGLDLYYVIKEENGRWSSPKRMPDYINTDFDEESPFISKDGKSLYFSSNGLPGYGGFDVYRTTFDGKEWSAPVNLGMPVNSTSDDVYFILDHEENGGYLASSRTGGYGDLDIYRFGEETILPEQLAQARIVLNDSSVKESNLSVKEFSIDLGNAADFKNRLWYQWTVNDSVVGKGETFSYSFDESKSNKVSATIYDGDKKLNTKEISFEARVIKDEQTNAANSIANNNQLYSKTNFEAVYFGLNECGLSDEAIVALDKNIAALKKNPGKYLIIESYCDARGSAAYNKQLSAKRSQAVMAYLLKNGVSRSQIKSVKNFGESKIANRCTNAIECSNEEHAVNRRVEFKLY